MRIVVPGATNQPVAQPHDIPAQAIGVTLGDTVRYRDHRRAARGKDVDAFVGTGAAVACGAKAALYDARGQTTDRERAESGDRSLRKRKSATPQELRLEAKHVSGGPIHSGLD